MFSRDLVYDDSNPEQIETLPLEAQHRPVDVRIVAADKEGTLTRYITQNCNQRHCLIIRVRQDVHNSPERNLRNRLKRLDRGRGAEPLFCTGPDAHQGCPGTGPGGHGGKRSGTVEQCEQQ